MVFQNLKRQEKWQKSSVLNALEEITANVRNFKKNI